MTQNRLKQLGKWLLRQVAWLLVLTIVASFLSVAIVAPKVAKAQTYKIQTGYYMGNGSAQRVSGLGFTPQMVILKSDANTIAAVFKTSVMPVLNTAYLGTATADSTAGFITFEADGFTVASTASTNNGRFTWIAFTGSDCSGTGTFCIGSYQGSGAIKGITKVGFAPDLVIVKSATAAVQGTWRSSAMGANVGQYFSATAQDATGILFQSLDPTGFTVGTTNSSNTITYYFAAFKNVANTIKANSYAGDGLDPHNVADPGFQPNFVFTKNSSNAIAPVYNIDESNGDNSSYFTATADLADSIQALNAAGFQVGLNATANSAGVTYFYAAFAGTAAHTSSGTFLMTTGSYTGTTELININNLSFAPDLVIIKGNTTQSGVFRSDMIGGDSTAYLDAALANFTGGIIALNPDGFSVGTSTVVNSNAITYYWVAYGRGWSEETNSGAYDFAIGAYYGNAIDSRNITRVPSQPDLVAVKRSGATGGTWRTSSHVGDASSLFAANADAANDIQLLNSDGFQIGTAANVNTAANIYWYFAFKKGTNFTLNSYTGTGASQDITTVGFQPDYVWIKRTTGVQGVERTSDLVGDGALPFIAAGSVANAIAGFIANGFTVTTAAETNTVPAGTYWYAAWKDNSNPVPTLTEILFLTLLGCVVFLGVKTGAIKIKKNGRIDPKDIIDPPINKMNNNHSHQNKGLIFPDIAEISQERPKQRSIDGICRREIRKQL